jgi:hypothetical protein
VVKKTKTAGQVALKQQVVAKFSQFYEGKEAEAKERYCVLTVSSEMKALLLAEDEKATGEVMIAFFQAGLLLVGNGLVHVISFLEEKDVEGRHEAWLLEL